MQTLLAILQYTEECFWISSPGRCLFLSSGNTYSGTGLCNSLNVLSCLLDILEKHISLPSLACALQNSYYKHNHNSGNAIPWLWWKFALRQGPGHTAESVHVEQTALMQSFIKPQVTETKASQFIYLEMRWEKSLLPFLCLPDKLQALLCLYSQRCCPMP